MSLINLSRYPSLFRFAAKSEFGAKQRYKFYIKLSQLLGNGVPLGTALQQIESVALRTKKRSIMPLVYARWRRNVENGMNFGQCLAPYIPNSEAILLESGAESGLLVDAINNVADTVEQQSKIRKAIIANAAYPVLLLVMLVSALVLASYMVIPAFAVILPVEKWTGMAYIVAQTAAAIREYGILFLIILVIGITLISISLPRWSGPSRRYVENIIPWNLYRMWQGSAFLLAVSAIMNAGVKLDEVSLGRISRNASPYLAQRINAIKRGIVSGANLGDALSQTGYAFPDAEIISDLQIYARLRGFDKNLVRITRNWVKDLVEKVEIIMRILNTVILFLITLFIIILLSSLYAIVQQIRQDI